ncbi:MAG: helix-turn-helix domain-containing protein [Firmicutes bacterium]|nr:helix-turn-helix domain-containing protein [Bacillota bacterium]
MEYRFYECHGHIMMGGADYASSFNALASCGVSYFRDGGDADGITAEAKQYVNEHPELGLEYVTPVFAIHRKGRYGGIVGRPFEDIKEYRALVAEAASKGADFIKIMYSGIITFREYGELSTPPLDAEEIKELVNIAHGEGFAVMAHCNGRDTVLAAIEAGTDSVEHGAFMDEECSAALAESDTIWEGVFMDGSRYPYNAVCLTDVDCCKLLISDLEDVMKDPSVSLKVIALLSRKLHDANDRVMLLSTSSPKARLAGFLLNRSRHTSSDTVVLRLDDIAASIQLRPETVSRRIKEMEREGLLEKVGQSSIRIMDRAALEAVYSAG